MTEDVIPPASPSRGRLLAAAGGGQLVVVTGGNSGPFTYEDADRELIDKIRKLPPDVGYLMINIGILGIIVPGIFGLPFLVAGAAVVSPRSRNWILDKLGRRPPRALYTTLRQISRFVDDVERRYPAIRNEMSQSATSTANEEKANMAASKTFKGVTPEIIHRLSGDRNGDYKFVLNADGRTGTLSGKSAVGDLAISFEHDPAMAEVKVTVLKKPALAPVALVWAEFTYALRQATAEVEAARPAAASC